MFRSRSLLARTALSALLCGALLAPAAARADSATVRLIQLLIAKGILTKSQAASLLAQAKDEAAAAPAKHAAAKPQAAEPPPAEGEVRVTYVPQFVRDQIAAQVRQQMLKQMEDQGFAAPNQVPDWLQALTIYGDLRLRAQLNLYPHGNVGANGLPYPFPDFNSINNIGTGFNTSGNALPPLLNVSENRNFYQFRARIGVHDNISDWISTDIRLASGNDTDPVSENQTFGSPGDYSKYAVYIDRAYFDFHPSPYFTLLAGRTPKPYDLSTLMYAPDLNFDGLTAKVTVPVRPGLETFLVGGVYPVFNTALNFSSTQLVKGSSHNAYEFAAQGGASWRINPDYTARLAAGYFGYSNVNGELSAPCFLFTAADTCNTDQTRLPYYQFGNTMFGIRNIVVESQTAAQGTPEYYGLSSQFGVLDIHGQFDMHNFDPIVISFEGEFAKNLLFNRAFILARNPINNFGSNNQYQGGDTAYLLAVTAGYPQPQHAWEWNLRGEYRYVASDAFIGSFTDQNFHLGGTNAKGYILTADLGIGPATWLMVRWSSQVVVSGPPDSNDMLQIDLNTSF